MRKVLAIALMAIFGMPLFAPLVASGALSEASLPACCRRNGKHHCSMTMRNGGFLADHAPAWQAPLERCPYYPARTTTSPSSTLAMIAAPSIFAELVSHPTGHAQTESKLRISRDRARQKRGPPFLLHS
ncbi:hypothetical protein [Edaphobacter sp. 12200R-103]|uniref:hypothetical protein n=1 Tax=Edaphobacter sp. 12200R-103 TaxID=2703788 RepID=UPI00138CF996|nr:hypothetical protein [Edaphobacter sp. 12200R-103]QHS53506.1 hypothetical protein GWR55_18645 [Edaphobacter sp. 12200R-103]